FWTGPSGSSRCSSTRVSSEILRLSSSLPSFYGLIAPYQVEAGNLWNCCLNILKTMCHWNRLELACD
ncbi:unnamed protein product, partial [Arabidopsis halleri]